MKKIILLFTLLSVLMAYSTVLDLTFIKLNKEGLISDLKVDTCFIDNFSKHTKASFSSKSFVFDNCSLQNSDFLANSNQIKDGYNWSVNRNSVCFLFKKTTESADNITSKLGFNHFYSHCPTEAYNLERTVLTTFYQDSDADGYGNDNVSIIADNQPVGYVPVGGDCDDTNNTVHPNAFEICFDGIDQNCDGNLNDSCPIITAQLRIENCGSTLTSIDQVVRGNRFSQPLPAGVLAMRYRFKITNLLTNTVRIVERSNYIFQLTYTDFAEYNTPYSVEVEVRLNQEWTGSYGPACTILTPDVPNTVLATSSCGTTVSQMNNIIRAVAVPAAINYEYEVSLIEGGIAIETITFIRSGESFNLLQLTGISIKYAAEYRVRIKVQVLTPIGLMWSTQYGAACSVFSPPAPEAKIEGCEVENGIAPVSLTTLIFSSPHGGATQYRYKLSHVSGYDQVYTTPSRYFRLSNFNTLSSLIPGEIYSITIEVQIYGFYYPGKDCNILVPGGAPIVPLTRGEDTTANLKSEFKAVAYPNPFENSFAIDLKTSNTSPVTLAIYDMTGRLLDTKEIKAEGLFTQTIGERYPSGVYNVIVTQGENTQSVRIVKK